MVAKRVGDLELQEDIQFQHREWFIQRIGWWALGVFVVAAALGLFGAGPFSRAQARDAGAPIWVEYERFARAGAPSRLSVHFEQPAAGSAREVLLNRAYFDSLRFERILPEPERIVIGVDQVRFQFGPDDVPGAHTVVFDVEPTSAGVRRIDIGAGHGRNVTFSQIVFF